MNFAVFSRHPVLTRPFFFLFGWQYTAHASASGQGRNGEVVSNDEKPLKLRLAMPKQLGGKGDGSNPEQLFAMGYSCTFTVLHLSKSNLSSFLFFH
jgi:organic hydroperoxide reductase OsmC/OhrA